MSRTNEIKSIMRKLRDSKNESVEESKADEEDAGELVILKMEDTDSEEEESYVSVDDEETLNKVFEIFKDKFKDEFNFIDEEV